MPKTLIQKLKTLPSPSSRCIPQDVVIWHLVAVHTSLPASLSPFPPASSSQVLDNAASDALILVIIPANGVKEASVARVLKMASDLDSSGTTS